uniref:5'-3' DNA helicase ZGRF1 isoform X2 n=1 Tax=Pogona vitticeps TaxID=103695 RepID=A0A6J0UCI6_9SAUR
MACQEFTVLYTHQKTKKSKVWQDGILKATVGGNKAILFDEKGQLLDNIFVKFQIKPGDDLECERYLITIEGEKVSGMGSSDQQKVTEREVLRRNNLKSFASSSFHQPVGLKRKYTGFRVPRQMPKKMIMEESSSIVSPAPEDIHSVFPSQFYNSCPLFSAPCKKKENVRQLPIIEDVCMKKTDSVPVLASIPYADEYKVVQREAHSTNSADYTCLKLEFHVDDGRISSDCQKSTDKAISQNVRSKAQILALLSKEHKDFNTSPVGNTVSVKNLALASVKLDSHQEGLSLSEPPRTTDSLLREKTKCLLGSTNNTIQENTEYSKLLFSKRNVQTKSQWDAYLSSCFAEESSNIDDAENKNASDLQAVLKDKENNTIRSQQNKNQRTIPQVSSLEINMSPISKHSVKHQQHSFISPDSINNKNSDTEITSSFDHINYLDCISAAKILEDELSKSSKHMMCDNLAKSGNESPNESYPVGSQCFSNASVCGDLGDPNKQLTEVNFNLLETVDLSDTEDEEFHVSNMLSQGSKSFEEDTGIQLEVSVETNHNAKIYNNGKKDNVQPASQQDRDMNYFSRSQPLQLCDEFPEKSNKMENGSVLPFIKELQHSQALAVAKRRFAKVTSEEMQRSFLYSGSPKLNSSLSSDVAEPTTATINRLHDHSDYKEPDSPLELELIPDQCPEDCEPTGSSCRQVEFHGYQLKGSAASETMTREPSLCVSLEPSIDMVESEITAKHSSFSSAQELSSPVLSGFFKPLGLSDISEHVSNISTVNREFDLIEEQDNEFFTFSESSNLSNKIMTNSPNLILDFTPCASRELNKILSLPWISSQLSGYHFSPSQSNKKTAIDMHEEEFQPLGIVPNLPMDDSKSFFKESNCPKSDLLRHLPTPRMRTPVVTVPVNEELADSDVCCSIMTSEQVQQPLDLSEVTISDNLKTLRPEDRMHETFVADNGIGDRQGVPIRSAFPNVSEQKRPSKWQKYQNTTCSDLRTENSNEVAMTSDIRAESFLGMPLDDIGESWAHATGNSLPGSVHLQTMESMLCKQSQNLSSQDSVSEGRKLSLHLNNKFCTEEAPKVLGQLNRHSVTRHIKNPSELLFPGAEMVECATVPKRQIHIPAEFQSPAHYKQVFTSALIEHLNILLFELSQKLHKALEKVDISFYTSMKGQEQKKSSPLCNHKIPTKVVMVKKEGRNKGRFFYACEAPKADRCDFFKWVEDVHSGQVLQCRPSVAFHDVKSIGTYLRGQKIPLYEECQLLMRKAFDVQRRQFGKLKKFNIAKTNYDCESKSRLYLKLNRKESSSVYSKDDLWVVSKTLTFEPLDTFIACSVFFGPSSTNEVELEPLKGYSPSNWCSNMIVHALLVCNASAELTTLRNIEENFSSATLPIMQHLLTKNFKDVSSSDRVNKQKFKPPALNTNTVISGSLSPEIIMNLANKMIETFQLNKDQATALIQIGAMMASQNVNTEVEKHVLPITIIHGVFGSGKSYLLAVVILFLVQIFETSEATNGKISVPWKVLISSSTNVAVDRVLLCLLDLGFEEFIRVGSIRKIAKSILPHSLHAGSGSENEQVKELLALMKEDLTPAEKVYVRKTIEHHKLGTNKALLQQVRVVGATCAACPFPCMKNLKFPIVILDECSQMTEPASLLPIARFGCEKLILVGDSKQLPPTIQGSESTHSHGLEQTLFDRLGLMGHEPILLRTQYRCHPAISAIASDLFYEGKLLNGISEMDRTPLMEWLPTLCFYNVNGLEQMERDNSFHNMAEASFSVKLIEALIASGAEGSMIGVITLYKSQMSKICNLLGAINSDTFQIKAVQVSTVDAFQGAEKEIIILSCVRTKQVGFIDSEKRMNVALTRGKRHLLIVGNLNCLRKNKLWGCVIQHCSERKNGLQHVGECEQLLSDIIKSCLQRKKEEEINRPKV